MAANTTNDMTSGSPVRLILRFMVPVCLGNIFQQFYNVADSIVAGRFIGVNALAAIGSTGSLMFFVTGWLMGLSSGFAILVSQRFGAKDYNKMRHYVAMSVYLTAAFAILMTIGLLALNEPILRMMNFSAEIMPDVTAYMRIIYAGLIVTASYNSLAAFLRALGDSRSPLYFLIISAMINVVLDISNTVVANGSLYGIIADRQSTINIDSTESMDELNGIKIRVGNVTTRSLLSAQVGDIVFSADISIEGNATMTLASINSTDLGKVRRVLSSKANPGRLPTFTASGTISGPRYRCIANGIINTLNGGTEFFPGDTAGTTNTGGQYL